MKKTKEKFEKAAFLTRKSLIRFEGNRTCLSHLPNGWYKNHYGPDAFILQGNSEEDLQQNFFSGKVEFDYVVAYISRDSGSLQEKIIYFVENLQTPATIVYCQCMEVVSTSNLAIVLEDKFPSSKFNHAKGACGGHERMSSILFNYLLTGRIIVV